MTKSRLGVDLEDTTGKTAYTEYNMFGFIRARGLKYQLSIETYSVNQFLF